MNPFEYALGLLSVLIGLALGDVAMSMHKLVRHWRTVRWDGRVLLSALLVVVMLIRMWFSFWGIRSFGIVLYFPFYLSMFAELMILFLVAAACLPDDPAPDIDLGAFYEENRPALWIAFALFQTGYALHGIYFNGPDQPLRVWAGWLVPILFFLLLAFVRTRWLHYALPLTLILWVLSEHWGRSLAAAPG
ncbi:MAG TPA: hypothetical protein VF662_09210 [Allosphingosinicella sp.]|jgi:hypothetical protein